MVCRDVGWRWVAAAVGLTLLTQLLLCFFFHFGAGIPLTSDLNLGNYRDYQFQWPPVGYFENHHWLGHGVEPMALTPFTLGMNLPAFLVFTAYYPFFGALATLAFYCFLREVGLRRPAALLGGLVYGWQGDLLSSIFSGHFYSPPLWVAMALALWATVRAVRSGSFYLAVLAGAGAGCMVALLADKGGLGTLLIPIVYLVEISRRGSIVGPTATRPLLQMAVSILVAVALAMASLSSVLSVSTSDASVMGGEEVNPTAKFAWVTQWSLPPKEVLTFIIPGFYGWFNDCAEGPYWGTIGQNADYKPGGPGRNFCTGISTFGTVPCLLILFSLIPIGASWWRRGRAQSADLLSVRPELALYGQVLLIAGLCFLILSFGKFTFIYYYLFQLPYMDSWRNPLKWLLPASVCFIYLAALGAEWINNIADSPEDNEEAMEWRKTVTNVSLFLAILLGLTFLFSLPLGVFLEGTLDKDSFQPDQASAVASAVRKSTLLAALLGTAWWGLVRLIFQPSRWRPLAWINPWLQRLWDWAMSPGRLGASLVAVAGLMSMLQLIWVQSHFLMEVDYRTETMKTALIERLTEVKEPMRVKVKPDDPICARLLATTFPYWGISCFDIPSASRVPHDYARFFTAIGDNADRALFLAGVRYYLAPKDELPSLTENAPWRGRLGRIMQVYLLGGAEPSHVLVEIRESLSRVTFVPELEVIAEPADLDKRLVAATWNPRKTLLVEPGDIAGKTQPPPVTTTAPEHFIGPVPPPKAVEGSVDLEEYTSTRIRFRAHTPKAGGYAMINDHYDDNWHVTINGQPGSIFRTDVLMRGIQLPPGESEVVLTFHASSQLVTLNVGAWLLAVLAGVGYGITQVRRTEATDVAAPVLGSAEKSPVAPLTTAAEAAPKKE